MGRWFTVVLVAVVALAPAAHATCRYCDVPVRQGCHGGSAASDRGSPDTPHERPSGSSDCTCAVAHPACLDSSRSTVEPLASSQPNLPPVWTIATVWRSIGNDGAGGVVPPSGVSPPRARLALHLACHVLLI